MKKIIFTAVVCVNFVILGCAADMKKAADTGWQPLFNGKNLDGWIQRGGQAKYFVKGDEIVGQSVPNTPNSFLCTKKEYRDFILELDFKVDANLNSGVQIRSSSLKEYKNGQVHGYQVEIDAKQTPAAKGVKNFLANGEPASADQPRSWTGGIYDEARRGWLNDLSHNEAARKAFMPDKWNHFRIEANGDSIKTWLNGTPAADMKDSMTHMGFIALQVPRHQRQRADVRQMAQHQNKRFDRRQC